MVLEWTLEEASLLQDHLKRSMGDQNHQTFSSISLLGTIGPGDRRLCTYETCACVIHTNLQLHILLHYMRRSTVNLFCYISREPQRLRTTRHFLTGYRLSIKGHYIKLVLVSSHTAACCSSIVNLCLRGVHVLREALVSPCPPASSESPLVGSNGLVPVRA